MSKTLKLRNLAQRNATRSLLAVSLSFSLAAFGCTTDRTLGNGDPVTTPGIRTSPTASPGSESAPSVPGSMTSSSSYNAAQALPTVKVRTARSKGIQRLTPDQAAALMAQHQPQAQPRVRYLGQAYPGGQQSGAGQSATGYQTGQYRNPALQLNPQLTVNSSITSAPVAAIASGAGGDGGSGGGATGAAFIGSSVDGANAGLIAGGGVGNTATAGANAFNPSTGLNLGGNASDAAPTFAPTSAAGLSPLGAGPGARLPLGATTVGVTPTTSPTAFSARNPDPTISSFPALAAVNSATRTNAGAVLGAGANVTNGTTANGTIANGRTANATANATAITTTTGTTTGRVSPVRVTRDASGRTVITNNTTTTSRNQ